MGHYVSEMYSNDYGEKEYKLKQDNQLIVYKKHILDIIENLDDIKLLQIIDYMFYMSCVYGKGGDNGYMNNSYIFGEKDIKVIFNMDIRFTDKSILKENIIKYIKYDYVYGDKYSLFSDVKRILDGGNYAIGFGLTVRNIERCLTMK